MKTKMYSLKTSPKKSYRGNVCGKLSEFDVMEFESFPPDAIFYWYVNGGYDGYGALIAVKDNRWYIKDLGHCSCYGPLEDFATDISEYTIEKLDDILTKGTDDWQKEYDPLVALAKKKGYK
jgi:hypothetical protein